MLQCKLPLASVSWICLAQNPMSISRHNLQIQKGQLAKHYYHVAKKGFSMNDFGTDSDILFKIIVECKDILHITTLYIEYITFTSYLYNHHQTFSHLVGLATWINQHHKALSCIWSKSRHFTSKSL